MTAQARGSVVVGVFGTKLDRAKRGRWRPTVALAHAPDHLKELANLEEVILVHGRTDEADAQVVARDLKEVRPGLQVRLVPAKYSDHYNYSSVFGFFEDLLRGESGDDGRPKREYFFHVTTGSPVVHAVLHDLAFLKVFSARLLITVEPVADSSDTVGEFRVLADPSDDDSVRRALGLSARDETERLRRRVGVTGEETKEIISLLADLRLGARLAMPILILGVDPVLWSPFRCGRRIPGCDASTRRTHLSSGRRSWDSSEQAGPSRAS